MEIDLNKLRQVTNSIFDHIIVDLKIEAVTLEDDYYWDVPADVIHDMTADLPQLDIGQLSDDLDFTLMALSDRDQAVSLLLTHVAPLLRYIGTKIGQ